MHNSPTYDTITQTLISFMKITIIGTHSTGKTTIINTMQEYLLKTKKTVTILKELSRECPFPINENTTLTAQAWILDNQIKKEQAIDHSNGLLISDRSSIDNFAYMYRAIGESLPHKYEKQAVEHMASYDFIYKTQKLEIDAKKDKVRSTDYEFRDNIDWLIINLLEIHNIPYINLPATTDTATHIDYIMQSSNF